MNPTCKQAPGSFAPLIDRDRCEGKGPCIAACPHDVLALYTVPRTERAGLTLIGRLKGMAHGWRQAHAVHPEQCMACGACVAVCPENAISITRAAAPA